MYLSNIHKFNKIKIMQMIYLNKKINNKFKKI